MINFVVFFLFLESSRDSLNARVDSLISQGFIQARIVGDSIEKGSLYQIGDVTVEGLSLSLPGLKEKLKSFKGLPASKENLEDIPIEILKFLENRGYAFATARFKTFKTEETSINPSLQIDKGSLAIIKGIRTTGLDRTNIWAIQRLFKIKEGVFIPELLEPGKHKLLLFPFLRLNDYYFEKERGKLFLVLNMEDESSSYILGAMGYDTKQGGFFGSLNLELLNLFGTLRKLKFSWERITIENQALSILYQEPFIFSLDLFFAPQYIFKQRKDFFREEIQAEFIIFLYPVKTGIGAGYVEERDFINDTTLYRLKNIASISYGVFPIHFYPGSAVDIRGEIFRGREPLYKFKFLGEERIKKGLFGLKLTGIYLRAEKKGKLLSSEGYYIGGQTTLRGYKEEQFQIKEAAVGQTEFHILPVSFLSLFTLFDLSWFRDISGIAYTNYAYGIGISGSRKNTRVKLIFAIPSEGGFKNSKVHLLLQNRF